MNEVTQVSAGSVGRARRNRVFRSTPSDPMNSLMAERTMEMELATRSSISCIHPAGGRKRFGRSSRWNEIYVFYVLTTGGNRVKRGWVRRNRDNSFPYSGAL